jgi:hypothetical protein
MEILMDTPAPARKNTLLLFSKLPEPGLVKTRLTTLKDGLFEPEVASTLYHCMLFDVVEICMAALDRLEQAANQNTEGVTSNHTYELVISTTPPENAPRMQALFDEAGTWPRPIKFIADTGASFDEHYNCAFEQCWQAGSDYILSMGADMPALTVWDVCRGFEALHHLDKTPGGGIVLAPDQELGVSVIGWGRTCNFDHTGVFYNVEGVTVLPAYIHKAKRAGLPAIYLPPIPDVDTMADLMHNITLIEALNYCAPHDGNTPPHRCAKALKEMGWDEVIIAPNNLFDPREHIDK